MRTPMGILTLLLVSLNTHALELRTFLPLKINTDQAAPYLRLLARLGELSGITFKLEDSLPPARAKIMLQNGQLDCSVGQSDISMADILSEIAWVQEPLLAGRLIVVTTRPFSFSSQADLAGKKVLAGRESAPVEILLADKKIQFIEAPDANLSLKMLLAGRGDVLVIHEAQFSNTLEASSDISRDQFYVAPTPFLIVNNHIWLSKKYESLVPKLNEAFLKLKTSGEYARIMSGKG